MLIQCKTNGYKTQDIKILIEQSLICDTDNTFVIYADDCILITNLFVLQMRKIEPIMGSVSGCNIQDCINNFSQYVRTYHYIKEARRNNSILSLKIENYCKHQLSDYNLEYSDYEDVFIFLYGFEIYKNYKNDFDRHSLTLTQSTPPQSNVIYRLYLVDKQGNKTQMISKTPKVVNDAVVLDNIVYKVYKVSNQEGENTQYLASYIQIDAPYNEKFSIDTQKIKEQCIKFSDNPNTFINWMRSQYKIINAGNRQINMSYFSSLQAKKILISERKNNTIDIYFNPSTTNITEKANAEDDINSIKQSLHRQTMQIITKIDRD